MIVEIFKNLKDAVNISKFKTFENRRKVISKKRIFKRYRDFNIYRSLWRRWPRVCKLLKVGKNGNIKVKIGTQSNGQGHETSYGQIVSEILDIDISTIQVIQGNSKEIEKGSGTGGSRSTPVGGSALKLATENLLNKIKN